MTSIEIIKEIRKKIKDKIDYEEIVDRVPYYSTQRILAYKRVLIDLSKLERLEKKNDQKS